MEQARERSASTAVLTAIPMVGQLVASRAVRDTVFLTEYDAVYLPRVMLGASVLSLLAAVAVGLFMPRRGPRVTAAGLAILSGSSFVVEAALLEIAPRIIAVVLYLHVSVLGALVISAFSSVINERFDPLFAKTVVAHAGTGGALGGVLGGVLALVLANELTLPTVLYGLGAIGIVTAFGMWRIGKSTQPNRVREENSSSGIRTIVGDRYLRSIATTIVLLGAAGVFVDYAMKAEADLRFPDEAGLLSFFTVFYTVTALITFLVQAGLAKPLLGRVGLGGTMAVLPLAIATFAGLGAIWTQWVTATLARGAQTVVSSSLFRSGYELLYTPISPGKKRATKAVIDIACNRIGYGIGSVIILGVVAMATSVDTSTAIVLVLALVTALVGVWMVTRLQGGYVDALATSLRDGSVVLQAEDVVDATTMYTLAQSATALNRHELLQRIENHRQSEGLAADTTRNEALAEQATAMLSDDPRRVLGALVDPALSPALASLVIARLGDDLYARPAYDALARMGDRITGHLVDALVSRETPVHIRRRLPRLLRGVDAPLASMGLLKGLSDPEFEVRFRCANALGELRHAGTSIEIPQSEVMDIVLRELEAGEGHSRRRGAAEESSQDIQNEIGTLLGARKDQNLQHVFTLLSLSLDREAIVLSLRALSSEDENLRGTALEYLSNVLPDAVREALWPRLTVPGARRQPLPGRASPEDLLQSMQSIMIDQDRLVK